MSYWQPYLVEPCGTPAAYRRHLRHGENPCPRCKEAHAGANTQPRGIRHGTTRKTPKASRS